MIFAPWYLLNMLNLSLLKFVRIRIKRKIYTGITRFFIIKIKNNSSWNDLKTRSWHLQDIQVQINTSFQPNTRLIVYLNWN